MQLKGMTWDHPRGYQPVVAASQLYAQTCGVVIEWSKRSLQAFADAPIHELAQDYDFIVLDHPHVGQIAETGALLPLPAPDDMTASLGGSAESYFWNDLCWAYAIDAACQMAAYRPDLTNGLPATWEDFFGDTGKAYHPLTPLLPVDAFDMLLTIVAGRGGEEMPVGDTQLITDENAAYALEVLRTLYKLGPSEQVQMNPIAVLERLTSGDDFYCSPCLFGYVNYVRSDFRNKQVSYFDSPLCAGFSRPRAILGGAGIGVSAQSQHPADAIKFAQWIASQEIQSGVYLENNGQPANRHTWLEQHGNPELAAFFSGGFHTIDNAWTRPRDPWFLGFVDEMCEIMPDFFLKEIPIDAFIDQMSKLYRHHLNKE